MQSKNLKIKPLKNLDWNLMVEERNIHIGTFTLNFKLAIEDHWWILFSVCLKSINWIELNFLTM